jgi:steroid 5-alpha reductase family enzyme
MTRDAEERQALVAMPAIIAIAVAITWAGCQGGRSVGALSIFALCALLSFGINWLGFFHAWTRQTERFFDLMGSLSYGALIVTALVLGGVPDLRSLLLGIMVIVWAARLGSFLFRRISRDGSDRRFDEIKPSWPRFLMTWTLQGLWVLLTLSCALAAITSSRPVPLDAFAIVGGSIWLFGFAIEVVADRQKSRFRSNPANRERFISTGLWAWSRHPNYFGEIVLWIGVAVVALPVLRGWQYATLVSPLFVYVLLTRISGVPLLESRGKKKWGRDPEYQAYRENTPVLFPRRPRPS